MPSVYAKAWPRRCWQETTSSRRFSRSSPIQCRNHKCGSNLPLNLPPHNRKFGNSLSLNHPRLNRK